MTLPGLGAILEARMGGRGRLCVQWLHDGWCGELISPELHVVVRRRKTLAAALEGLLTAKGIEEPETP